MAWAYIAAAAGGPMQQTFDLVTEHRMIVRAFFINGAQIQALGRAQGLAVGDSLVLIYIDNRIITGAMHCKLVDAQAIELGRLNEYPQDGGLHPVIAGRRGAIPNCFAVAPSGTKKANAIEEAKYPNNMMDPQIGQWVVLAVKLVARYEPPPKEWQQWYQAIQDRQNSIQPFPDDLLSVNGADDVAPPDDEMPRASMENGEAGSEPLGGRLKANEHTASIEASTHDSGRVPPEACSALDSGSVGHRERCFDSYVFVDWSGANCPGREGNNDTIWYAASDGHAAPQAVFCPTRNDCIERLQNLLRQEIQGNRRVLIGFDFPYAYPQGFAAALCLPDLAPPWRAIWAYLQEQICDDDGNRNNRWSVAADINAAINPFGMPGPFWGCPEGTAQQHATLQMNSPEFRYGDDELPELRITEQRFTGVQPTWKLCYPGSVGSQSLVGIPRLYQLRYDRDLAKLSAVWPFETGFFQLGEEKRRPWILHAEIWPGLVRKQAADLQAQHPTWTRDQAQVVAMCEWASQEDQAGNLANYFAEPDGLTEEDVHSIVNQEGWILGTPPSSDTQSDSL